VLETYSTGAKHTTYVFQHIHTYPSMSINQIYLYRMQEVFHTLVQKPSGQPDHSFWTQQIDMVVCPQAKSFEDVVESFWPSLTTKLRLGATSHSGREQQCQ
jgi:hypothetical protein